MTRRLFALAAAAAALSPPAPAAAGLQTAKVSREAAGSDTRWTYAVLLQARTQLQPGDYFTIYDFGGLIPGSVSTPDGWAVTVGPTGDTPPRLAPDDDPAVPNLTFRYAGPTLDGGQVGLGNFSAVSRYQDVTDSWFTARAHRQSDRDPTQYVPDSNITPTVVPVPTAPPGVPEPGTLALAALGLPVALGVRAVRRRKK